VLWHFLLESLAYIVAFRLYLHERRAHGDFLETPHRWTIVVAAIAGAAIGSKLFYWLEDPLKTLHHWNDFAYLMAGKTIVGAILMGTIAVEFAKRRAGITRRTGDLFAMPLAVGISIGRMGCLLAGLADNTYGLPTSLPWGIDLGDGVRRHPVELYETAAMIVLALCLRRIRPPRFNEGDRFRAFVLAYFSWRFLIDFLKPGVRFGGVTILQWICLVAFLWYTPDLRRMISRRPPTKEALANG
jgi:phosphatidylglycerol:prolipoprotein diacylglycerol transferase